MINYIKFSKHRLRGNSIDDITLINHQEKQNVYHFMKWERHGSYFHISQAYA